MDKKNKNLLFGRHPIIDAIKSGITFEKLILQQGVRGDFEKEVRRLSNLNNIPIQVLPKERFRPYNNKNHQGIIGYTALIDYYKLEDILPLIYERSETPLILLLDGVTDVRNFGAIARSAEICGVHTIVIPKKGSAQINAEAMKTSAGALANLPICRENKLSHVVEQLKLNGIATFASNLGTAKQIFDIDFNIPCAIIMGSEDKGVSPHLLEIVDEQFIIPQVGKTDSFNVSVATGIILYETVRQRMNSAF